MFSYIKVCFSHRWAEFAHPALILVKSAAGTQNGPLKMWLYINFEGLIRNVLGTIIASYKYRDDYK